MPILDQLREFAATASAALRAAEAVNAQMEEQLKAPVMAFLSSCGQLVDGVVDARPEARAQELGVRPDLAVLVDGLLSGHVELKAPGKGANPAAFRDARDREQWDKLKSHPNLLYCDGTEWSLFRLGERVGHPFRVSGDIRAEGANAVSPADAERLESLLRAFFGWQPLVPTGPRALAEMLAPLCRLLREEVLEALKNAESEVSRLATEWRQVLFPDADDPQFADAYAQTLTYALLLARLSGERDMRLEVAAVSLQSGHALLSQALLVLADPEAREELSLGVDLLQRSIGAVSPERLRGHGNDPWLYFYEDFLAVYDPALRKDRGVYYTPVEVVQTQVRLVARLLEERLGKPLTYADDGVLFLDPACGTGTYLLAALDDALAHVSDEQGTGAVPARASVLARNTHAFEILVGPYAVAHLRLTQGIQSAGGQLPADGVHVYLCDTLESPYAPDAQHVLLGRQLALEHRRAKEVKASAPVVICMGNPPYDRQALTSEDEGVVHRKGGWVRYGDDGQGGILKDFTRTLCPDDTRFAPSLYNDYVYFWRWALWKVFQSPTSTGPGVVSFITASSYLRGPGFRGMRQLMREILDELWIVDLEGESGGPRQTENVFNIQTPVAIAVGVRYHAEDRTTEAEVHYCRLRGTRNDKLARLAAIRDFSDLEWQECETAWQAPFLPAVAGAFGEWPLLADLFPWQTPGVKMHRTWPIATSAATLQRRWEALLSGDTESRRQALHETTDRKVRTVVHDFSGNVLPALASLHADASATTPARYASRPFDRRWILPDHRLGDRMRPYLWAIHGPRQMYLVSLLTTVLGEGPAGLVVADVPDLHAFRGSFGGKDVIPMWRNREGTVPNVTRGLPEVLTHALGQEVTAEDLFLYCACLLASSDYVRVFWDQLALSAPRVPVTKNRDLFHEVVTLGRELVGVETFGDRCEQPSLGPGHARCIAPISEEPDDYPEQVSYDEESQTLFFGAGRFAPVSREVWAFGVSGYPVVDSWLKARRRSGAGRRSSPLEDIRPDRWSASMTDELLQLLWHIEAVVALQAMSDQLLSRVVGGECFGAKELPEPRAQDRRPPASGTPGNADGLLAGLADEGD